MPIILSDADSEHSCSCGGESHSHSHASASAIHSKTKNHNSKTRGRVSKSANPAETKFLSEKQVQKLQKSNYAMVGSHSAVQICSWNKKAVRKEGVCYKQKFYGIECERCAQMSPTVLWCNENCVFCWRPMEWMRNIDLENVDVDSPADIISGTVSQRKKLLSGFGGLTGVDKEKLFGKTVLPSHWAISLSGEPTLYPKICELIQELKKLPDTKSVFLVTNAQKTDVFEKMATNPEYLPHQLYVSLDASNKEMFDKVNRAVHKDGWERLMKSLEFISGLKTRKVVRITLIRDVNDAVENLKDWSNVLNLMKPEFLEVKSYMHIGDSRSRLSRENMLSFDEINEWSKKLAQESGYVLKDFSKASRITLLVRPDLKGKSTKLKFARDSIGLKDDGIDF